MVKFNTSWIPAGSTITSARLKLYVQNASVLTLAAAPLNVHLLTQDWDQNATTWAKRTSSLNWSTAGGTFNAGIAATTNFSSLVAGTWVTFDLPVTDVQAWINTPSINYGVLLKRNPDGDPGTLFQHNKATFVTSEHTNANLRPKLEITYTAAGNAKPMAQITSPAAGTAALTDGALTIQAGALDTDGTVTKVDFLSESTLLATDTSAPFSFRWQHVPSTNVTIMARAYDNTGDGSDSAPVPVRIQSTIYSATMDSNPGWTLDSGWQYGQPPGYYFADNSTDDGDPSSGFTGNNVVGYLFSGTLPALSSVVSATTPAINCGNYSNVVLSFYYWLGIGEAYNGFRAGVDVSTNGTTWQNFWTNPNERMTVGGWRRMVLNISSIADGKSTVYIRWTMGPGTAYPFSGWNLDDVEVLGSLPPRSLADADGDGLPDSWEMKYFGSTGYSGTNDWDNDGILNSQEYLAGSSPTNQADFANIQIDASDPLVMFFDATEAGTNYYLKPRYYSLEFRTNLLAGQWMGVPALTNILAENQQIKHTNVLPNASFYRFRAWFP